MDPLQQWLTAQPALNGVIIALQPASADASFRRYFRINAAARTWIAMDASAERASCGPFVNIARLLAEAGLHVPAIIAENLEQGWLLLSDLGRQTYLDVLDENNADALFDAAIDALILLQQAACPAQLPRYDVALLRRELELFPEWYLQRHLGMSIDSALRAQLDEIFELLIQRAVQQNFVLVHRDFMPRNLMLSEPNPGVLDFQDAVCGPVSYDPICLFKDAFISWPEARVEAWLRRYWERAGAAGLPVPKQFVDFQTDCDYMGAQRHLKVIGIFARICYRDGKDKYLADVPRFFNYLRGAITRQPELASLGRLLDQLPVPA